MDYDIEVNVGANVYGRFTPKGVETAKSEGESVAQEEKQADPALFSLTITTDQKTLQPQYVSFYSPVTGQPVSMSCVEFELLWRMYWRGRNKLVQAFGATKKKIRRPAKAAVIGLPPVHEQAKPEPIPWQDQPPEGPDAKTEGALQ